METTKKQKQLLFMNNRQQLEETIYWILQKNISQNKLEVINNMILYHVHCALNNEVKRERSIKYSVLLGIYILGIIVGGMVYGR